MTAARNAEEPALLALAMHPARPELVAWRRASHRPWSGMTVARPEGLPSGSPTGEPPPSDATWNRRAWLLLGGLLLLRIAYAAVFPLDLAPDESYYWDWGRRPDIGYFSKPPMIGWLMGLAGWAGGNTEFGLKVFPGLLATAGLAFVYLLGRDMYGGRVGWTAVLLLAATPANVALNTFFTIDAPLFLAWSASLWLAWKGHVARDLRWAVWLVPALGAGFLTKQIQLVFPVLWVAFLLAARPSRASGVPWMRVTLVTVLALAFLFPPLVWNWRHDWITFRHTADEISHNPLRPWRSLKFFVEFVGGQAALGGVLTWLLMMGAVVAGARRWRTADDRTRFLVLFSLPGWLAFAIFAFKQRVEQNWPMVFYTAAVVMAASRAQEGAERWPRAVRPALTLGSLLAALLLAVPFVFPRSPWAGAKSDPTARVRGWRTLAEKVEPLRRRVPRPETTFLLAPDDRYVASALAFYLPDQPRTYCWEDESRPESQYGIWGRPKDRLGWDALVFLPHPTAPRAQDVARRFESWERVGEFRIELGPRRDRDRLYHVFLGRNLRSVEPDGELQEGR